MAFIRITYSIPILRELMAREMQFNSAVSKKPKLGGSSRETDCQRVVGSLKAKAQEAADVCAS
jgi:hypothetical protein